MTFELLGAEGSNAQLSCAGSGFVLSPAYVVKAQSIRATGAGQTGLLTTLVSLASHLEAVMVRVGASQRRPFIIAENKMSHMAKAGASVQDRRNPVCSLSQLFLRPLVTICPVVTVFLCGMSTCL